MWSIKNQIQSMIQKVQEMLLFWDSLKTNVPAKILICYTKTRHHRHDAIARIEDQGLKASGGGGTRMTPRVSSNWMSTKYPTPSNTEMAPVTIAVLWPFATSASAAMQSIQSSVKNGLKCTSRDLPSYQGQFWTKKGGLWFHFTLGAHILLQYQNLYN